MLASNREVGLWRECNTNDVVIARVFSRMFSEFFDLEGEIQRIHSFRLTTFFWACREQDRHRLIYCFECPVPSTAVFEGVNGSGLFRAASQITLPSTILLTKQVSVPKRWPAVVSCTSLMEMHSALTKCESGSQCVLECLIEAQGVIVISGELYFRLEKRTSQYEDLVNEMNGSSIISSFEVWNLDSHFVFRIWSATTSRLSTLKGLLHRFEYVPLSWNTNLPSSVLDHLPCCYFRSQKPTEIDGFVATIANKDGEGEDVGGVVKRKNTTGEGGVGEASVPTNPNHPSDQSFDQSIEQSIDQSIENHNRNSNSPSASRELEPEVSSDDKEWLRLGDDLFDCSSEERVSNQSDEDEEGEGVVDGGGLSSGQVRKIEIGAKGEIGGEGEGEGELPGSQDMGDGIKSDTDGGEGGTGTMGGEGKGGEDGENEGEGAGEKGEIGDGGNGAGEGQIGGDVLENYGMNEEDGRQAENAGRGRLSQSNSEIQGDGDKREIGDGGEGEGKGDGDKGEIEGGGEGEGEGVGEGKGEGKGDSEGEGKELEPDEKTLLRTSADSRDEEGENSGMADAMVVVGESDGKGDGQDKSEGEVSFFVFWF